MDSIAVKINKSNRSKVKNLANWSAKGILESSPKIAYFFAASMEAKNQRDASYSFQSF